METNAWVVQTVRKMDRDPRVEAVVSLTYNDTPITMLRNRAVLEARQEGCQYLLCIDSDMAPDLPYAGAKPFWDTAWAYLMERRVLEANYPDDVAPGFPPATVAAPYCGPSPNQCVYVFEWHCDATGKPNPGYKLEMIPRESAAIRSGFQEVAALPTGLILYDMRVFDVLSPPWYRYEHDAFESEKHTTEDVYQTRNAGLLGLPQVVAWDCWSGHVKTEIVPKPMIYTRNHVHQSLREAVLRGVDSDDRLVFVGNGRRDPDAVDAEVLPVRGDVPPGGVPPLRDEAPGS
jgi:hypothetical protein